MLHDSEPPSTQRNRHPEMTGLHVCTASRGLGSATPQFLHAPEVHPGHHEAAGKRMSAGVPRYPIEVGRVHPVSPEGRLRPLYGRRKELRGILGKAAEDRLL